MLPVVLKNRVHKRRELVGVLCVQTVGQHVAEQGRVVPMGICKSCVESGFVLHIIRYPRGILKKKGVK